MKIKAKSHIPTEPYGFIELEYEGDSIEEMAELYKSVKEQFIKKEPIKPEYADIGGIKWRRIGENWEYYENNEWHTKEAK